MANEKNLKSSLDWDQLIDGYYSSGKTAAQWCEEQGHKIHQLRYQIYKRNKAEKEVKSTNISFLPVEVIPEPDLSSKNSKSISLKIGKIEISISENFNPDLLAAVIKTLQPLC